MASDFDELDIDLNPFYVALQNKYVDLYERAQECCYLLCVPQTKSFNPIAISTDFVETHILRPSPYFKGQYMTTHSSNSKTLSLSDDGYNFMTLQGFSDEQSVKILREELAYNKDYQPYKILILERPLDSKFEVKDAKSHEQEGRQLHTHKVSVRECTDFLKSFPQLEGVLATLQKNIDYFCRHYMVLPDYLDDAVARLEDICTDGVKDVWAKLKPPLSADLKLREVLACAIESYVMNTVHHKVFVAVRQRLSAEDQLLLSKCHKLNKISPQQFGLRKEFSCPLPQAVVELANLGCLNTPREKLACLKSTVDNITEGIAIFLKEKSQTPYMSLAGLEPEREEEPCITSDDLIPSLVSVIAQAKCCHLHSDLFYIENFMWASTDRDDLGYCLVSFKAAAQYMSRTDFSHLTQSGHSEDTEISVEELMARTTMTDSVIHNKPATGSWDTQRRRQRQLSRIADMLQQSAQEPGSQRAGEDGPQYLHSIFPDRMMKSGQPDLIPQQERSRRQGAQLGDFLSALQDDDFEQSFGKQS